MVVVLGAGGGVGLAVVELAAGAARRSSPASTDDKLAPAPRLRAAHVVNYGRDDLRQAICCCAQRSRCRHRPC